MARRYPRDRSIECDDYGHAESNCPNKRLRKKCYKCNTFTFKDKAAHALND